MAARTGHAPVIAPRAGQVLPKSNASGQFLAMLLTMKYIDGLPLARMEYILGRMGVRVSRATLARWVIQAAEQMKPLIDRLQARLMTSPVIQMDETPVQVLKEPDRDPSTKSYMWVQRGGPPDKPIVLYHYAPSRSSQVPLKLLEGWKGYLMVDGYAGYDAVGRQPGVEHMACWVHARRGFMDAMKLQPKGQRGRADEMIAMVAELYAIEKNHRHEDDAARLQARQSESQKVLDRIRAWLDLHQPVTPPKSALGEAISYMDKYWPRLSRYIERGDLPIDNNASENAIRPFVMGRKAWLFSDTPAGADASALIYSLVETAKANGLEPWTWLCRVMRDLPDIRVTGQWDSLLPWNFRGDELITQACDSKAPTS